MAMAPVATVADTPAPDEPETPLPDASAADRTPYEALRGWIGHPAVRDDGSQFVLQPSVRPQIEEAFEVEPGLMDRLAQLATEPTFEITPVDFAGAAFALAFPANGAVEDDPRSLWLLVDAETGAAYAILTDGGDTFYRASHDARVDDLAPAAVAWMSDASGTPFEALARASEGAPMSP